MNNSSAFVENLLLSPLLRQRELSPFLSPFPTHSRRLSEDIADLIDFNLEQTPLHAPEALLPQPCQQEDPEETPFPQPEPQPEVEEFPEEPLSPPEPREEPPSTKLEEASQESEVEMPPLGVGSEELSPIEALINYLIVHSKMPEERVGQQAMRLFPGEGPLRQVFQVLARKFRRLRKTKEEMVKYCIRKAFKYVTELTKKSTKTRDLDCSMRQYFAEEGAATFSIPFKKNSLEKTMNGCFLRRIFACPRFTADYQRFVKDFRALMLQDNKRKVSYLAELIHEAVAEGAVGRVQKIKRLPWTMQILQETNQLALGLAETKGEGIGRRKR